METDPVEEDLDFSWIQEEMRLLKMQDFYPCESMKHINLYCVYVDKQNTITSTTKTTQDLEQGKLANSLLLKLIKQYQLPSYKLNEIVVFNVDIQEDKIQAFSSSEADPLQTKFLKIVSPCDDIVLEPSVSVFHSLNSIFLFYRETNQILVKSILKRGITNKVKSTKRVRIEEHGKNTRKHRENQI
jgi:hypothetical protein